MRQTASFLGPDNKQKITFPQISSNSFKLQSKWAADEGEFASSDQLLDSSSWPSPSQDRRSTLLIQGPESVTCSTGTFTVGKTDYLNLFEYFENWIEKKKENRFFSAFVVQTEKPLGPPKQMK